MRLRKLIEWWNWGHFSSQEEKQYRTDAVIRGTAAPILETTEAVRLHERHRKEEREKLERRRKEEQEKREEQKKGSIVVARSAGKSPRNNPEKEPSKVVPTIMIAYYGLMLLIGFIGYFSHAFDSLMGSLGIAEVIAAEEAYANILSFLLIAISPSFLLYLAAKAPFCFSKTLKKVFFVLGIALMVVLALVYNNICAKYDALLLSLADSTDTWDEPFMLRFSIAVGIVGFVFFYLISIMQINYENIRIKAVRFIVKLSQAQIFPLILTVLFTILLFPLAMLIVIVVVMIVILYVISIVLQIYQRGKVNYIEKGKEIWEITDERGSRRLIQHVSGNSYRDDTGSYWLSDDGGQTFRRE